MKGLKAGEVRRFVSKSETPSVVATSHGDPSLRNGNRHVPDPEVSPGAPFHLFVRSILSTHSESHGIPSEDSKMSGEVVDALYG